MCAVPTGAWCGRSVRAGKILRERVREIAHRESEAFRHSHSILTLLCTLTLSRDCGARGRPGATGRDAIDSTVRVRQFAKLMGCRYIFYAAKLNP